VVIKIFNHLQVSVEAVLKVFKKNVAHATKILLETIPKLAEKDWSEILNKKQVGKTYRHFM